MPRLRALTTWDNRKAGDEFDASDSDARVLCAPDLPGGPKARIVDRAMRADEPDKTAPAEPEPTPPARSEKRRYLRRDLRAQE